MADLNEKRTARQRLSVPIVVTLMLVSAAVGFGLGRVSRGWFRPAPPVAEARAVPSYSTAVVVDVDTAGRPARGPHDAPVTVVEFTDYECPFCGRYVRQIYPGLLSEYGDRVRYVIRNFPIASIHPHAVKAAEAAECAADQGRFWELHDVLFERQAYGLDQVRLEHYASVAGLEPGAFAECLATGAKREVVARDVRDGVAYGIRGTPTFFVNGRKLEGVHPPAVFREFLDEALRGTR